MHTRKFAWRGSLGTEGSSVLFLLFVTKTLRNRGRARRLRDRVLTPGFRIGVQMHVVLSEGAVWTSVLHLLHAWRCHLRWHVFTGRRISQ